MAAITVTAKVDGYHPTTGLQLVAGETYTIEEEQFGEEVFDPPAPPEE